MFLHLIRTVIERAIERILSLVSPESVAREAGSIIALNTPTIEIADALVHHERMESVFRGITSRAVAAHIDLEDLAEHIDTSDLAENIAYRLDMSDLAENISLPDLAGEIDLGDIAESIDYERLGKAVQSLHTSAVDEERVIEIVSQTVASALDAANRKTEPVIEQSPDLVARLLGLAVEKLLARADEAVKNGEV